MVLFNPKGLMARVRNHYIGGRKVTAAQGSCWSSIDVVAFVQGLKAQDPAMVVNLYPTGFRDALRAALDAAGMRWRYIEADEIERIRAQRRAEMLRVEAERCAEWRRARDQNRGGLECQCNQDLNAFERAFAYMHAEADRLRSAA